MSSPQPPVALLSDPIPSPRLSGPGLFFSGQDNATPVPEPVTDPETGASLPSDPLEDPAGGWASVGEWSDSDPSDLPDDPTSSAGSPAGSPNPLTKRAARETARAAVRTAGVMAHRTLANTNGKIKAGLYLTDDEDEKAVGDPLGNLAHRHAGVLGKEVSEDTADLMQAMFGVAGYFAKQMNNIAAARRIDAGEQPAEQVQA